MEEMLDEMMDDTAIPVVDLRRVVKANEDIKKVIRTSSGVNLVALNAMLIAKRSGERSRGFAVMSSELRLFSRKLEGTMGGLGTLIFGLVRDAAAMQKQQHEQQHLRAALAQGQQMRERVEQVLARKEEKMREIGKVMRQDWHNLQLQLNSVLQLCETGGFLSRSAKIEAVYGGEMSGTLKQVANKIEETVNEIISTLQLLRTQLAE
jgi:replicative DNA helicase